MSHVHAPGASQRSSIPSLLPGRWGHPQSKAWWRFGVSWLCWQAVEGLGWSGVSGGGNEGKERLAGESLHVMKVKKRIPYMVSLPYAHRSCGC